METEEAIKAVVTEDGIDSAIAWIAGVVDEKHNRIEHLEAALKKMLTKCTWAKREQWCGCIDCNCVIARAALGEKKDD